jgi:hypothetical protein
MRKCYLRAHLDHQALPTAYFFSFQPYIQSVILFSLHSSNKVSYMSDAGVVCGHSRFVLDLRVVLDNLCSRFIRNIFQTNSVSASGWVNRDWDSNIYIQQDALVTEFILSDNCSTCFGHYYHPSSGAQTTVTTASGNRYTVIELNLLIKSTDRLD